MTPVIEPLLLCDFYHDAANFQSAGTTAIHWSLTWLRLISLSKLGTNYIAILSAASVSSGILTGHQSLEVCPDLIWWFVLPERNQSTTGQIWGDFSDSCPSLRLNHSYKKTFHFRLLTLAFHPRAERGLVVPNIILFLKLLLLQIWSISGIKIQSLMLLHFFVKCFAITVNLALPSEVWNGSSVGICELFSLSSNIVYLCKKSNDRPLFLAGK